MNDLQDARKEKSTPEHDVIDEAIKDRGEGYTVFSIVSTKFTVRLMRKKGRVGRG